MESRTKSALEYAERNFNVYLEELMECLRIPSISTVPEHAPDVRRCAEWLSKHLPQCGFDRARVVDTPGHPFVLAEALAGDDRPTVLAYGHYDVQPPGDEALWDSPPFEPAIRGDKLFGRGACDDKGQLFMILEAVRSYQKSGSRLPVNLKLMLEGEEESGSKSLAGFIDEHAQELRADAALVCDTPLAAENTPTIVCSLRGNTYLEVLITGAGRDLHSGAYGGAAENATHVLARVIASLHDEENRVAVDGFYDGVWEITEGVRQAVAARPFDEDEWRRSAGIRATRAESGFTLTEAMGVRPCLDVHGVWGGYAEAGAKTIIPASAGAKLSARLVPNQNPPDITEKLTQHIRAHVPKGVDCTVRTLGEAHPIALDTTQPVFAAARAALQNVFGREPVYFYSGGSIPAVSMIKKSLGIDPVLLGMGLVTDRIHAPNEHFGIDRFRAGIRTLINLFAEYGGA